VKKLYSIKEITQMLNAELETSNVDYRYTEERVRARLRYLRSRATKEAEALHVEPKVYGYDRRAKYYTEEDVAKLRTVWIGPMLAEFTEQPENTEGESEQEEVEVREAKTIDIDSIQHLLPTKSASEVDWQNFIGRMLKDSKGKVFVAFIPNGEIVGWSQAEVSSSLSLIEGDLAGIVRAFARSDRPEVHKIIRLLLYRGQWWLRKQNVRHIIIELPTTLTTSESDYLEAEDNLMVYRFSNPQ
jgi:hypothetical protein